MVTFNSDVSFTNASLEGLSVSTSKILVLQSSAASSGQDVNDSTRDIYISMSTENNTYVLWHQDLMDILYSLLKLVSIWYMLI